MKTFLANYSVLIYLVAGILSVFVIRTGMAVICDPPRLGDLFTAAILGCSSVILLKGYRSLHTSDWVIAVSLGLVIGVSMFFATVFTPYPFLGVVRDNLSQAFTRGFSTMVAASGGLVIMRQGGPVHFSVANGDWHKFGKSLVLGLGVGFPLAVLNVFALQLTEGQIITWQNPLAAMVDALQPGIVEEVVYRFAFLGFLWLTLRNQMPKQAAWLSGLLALLVHNFMHFDDLFVEAPLVVLGMGIVMALLWGLPPTILALRRDLESAVAFHWIQDAARFLAGF